MVLAFLALIFIVVPLLELYVIIQVGQEIGALNTIGILILISVVGAYLSKREGMGVIARVRRQAEAGQVPTNELIDGFLILVGAIFLLVPGFISDAIGILMLFPPTRAIFRGFLKRRFRILTFGGFGGFNRSGPGRPGPDDVIDV
jgi:UPF0716 protein FxsA